MYCIAFLPRLEEYSLHPHEARLKISQPLVNGEDDGYNEGKTY
ncbi:hypothetical protein Daudx_1369 [Candidatus Desulforudis audaxviator]|nr:hypothetical protein Daudx_1369 [Candidatus Desulforudis audaxviator]